jgi:hypothetical protein
MKSRLFALFVASAACVAGMAGRAAAQPPDAATAGASFACDGSMCAAGDDGNCVGPGLFDGCGCGPTWQLRANLIWLHRSKPNDAQLATDFTPGGVLLLDAAEFRFEYETGPEIAILHRVNDRWDIEGRFFRVDGWNARRNAVFALGSEVQYTPPFGDAFFPATIAGSYRAQLNNVEVNGRRKINDGWSLLAGFRYLGHDEELRIEQDFGPGFLAVAHDIRAANGLYGFQLGVDTTLWSRGRLGLEGVCKAGVFANQASQRVHIGAATSPISYHSSAAKSAAAFAGEFGLTGVFRLTPRLAVRGGYQFLWIAGLVQASDQVAASNPIAGTAAIAFTGNPTYDGAFVGLELSR